MATAPTTTDVALFDPSYSDGTLEAVVKTSSETSEVFGVVFRHDGSDFFLFGLDADDDQWALYKYESSSWTLIDSGSQTVNTSTEYTLKVVLDGSSVKCYVDGTNVYDGTQTLNQRDTKHGLLLPSSSNACTEITFDGVEAATANEANAVNELPAFKQTGSGDVQIGGDAVSELPIFEQNAEADLLTVGNAVCELPPFGQSASGGAGATGNAVNKLPSFQQNASATQITNASASCDLGQFEQAANGGNSVIGNAVSVIPQMSQTLAAVGIIGGNGNAAFPAIEQTASAQLGRGATVVSEIPAFIQAGSVSVIVGGEAISALPAIESAATAILTGPRVGTGVCIIPAFDAMLVGVAGQINPLTQGRGRFVDEHLVGAGRFVCERMVKQNYTVSMLN